jgi:hypothetical protein
MLLLSNELIQYTTVLFIETSFEGLCETSFEGLCWRLDVGGTYSMAVTDSSPGCRCNILAITSI